MFKDGTVKAKEIATKKKNGTLNSSKQEERLHSILKELYPEYTIFREYKEERYPFYCDFYIKDLDVFIELNLHYTHGSHPFDPNSAEDQARLAKYSKYRYMIDVWTVRDPNKIEAAELNNLRYIRVYDPKFTKDSIEQSIHTASYGAPCRVLLLPEAKH